MGYRMYFYLIEKSELEELKVITKEDFEKRFTVLEEIGNETYKTLDMYNWREKELKCIHELGKYFDYDYMKTEEMFPDYIPMDDYTFKIAGKEGIKSTIEEYRKRINEYYKSLLGIDKDSDFDYYKMQSEIPDMTDDQYINRKARKHIKKQLHWWTAYEWGDEDDNMICPAYNLDTNNPSICDSWLYEHQIFELIRLYKTIDFDKYEVLLLGY